MDTIKNKETSKKHRMSPDAGEESGQTGLSSSTGGNTKWYNQLLGKAVWECLINIHVSNNPFLGIYPREMKVYVQKKTCWWIFVAAFTHNYQQLQKTQVAIRWWMENKLWYIHMWNATEQ